jgi:hypothetical protein
MVPLQNHVPHWNYSNNVLLWINPWGIIGSPGLRGFTFKFIVIGLLPLDSIRIVLRLVVYRCLLGVGF